MNSIDSKLKLLSELAVGNKILDIGCAEYPNHFLNGKVYGIDIQKINKPNNYFEFRQVNLNKQRIPYSDNFFDTVIAGEVIEHVENPSELLREVNRVLKNNGKLIISTPHASYYWDIIRNWFFDFIPSIDIGEHLSNWNILDFKRLLGKMGFEVNHVFGSIMQINMYFFRLNIPVKHFPKLSFVVIYECNKINKPIEMVMTRKSMGYNKISEGVIKVPNIKY